VSRLWSLGRPAAEYCIVCADTGIVRTRSRLELLHARSQLALAARAFGLHAIDMVCVDYTDAAYLADECADGRRLGFQAKQAIHPAQVAPIHAAFAPAPAEIARAARIVRAMAHAHASAAGAVGLDDGRGGREMIDAPMLKQVGRVGVCIASVG
jgi:citrate lyase subunit beta-like protein